MFCLLSFLTELVLGYEKLCRVLTPALDESALLPVEMLLNFSTIECRWHIIFLAFGQATEYIGQPYPIQRFDLCTLSLKLAAYYQMK